MQRIRFRQPHVPVNPRAFVEPAVAKAGVHPDHQKILSAVVGEVGDVEREGRVAVIVASDEISVEEHQRAAEGAVELQCDTPPLIFFRDVEGSPVPAHAGFRIAPAQRLVAVRILFLVVHERQLDGPVVRQIRAHAISSRRISQSRIQNSPLFAKSPWPMPKPRSRSGSLPCP